MLNIQIKVIKLFEILGLFTACKESDLNISKIKKIRSDLIRVLNNVRNIKEIKPIALSANQIGYDTKIFVFMNNQVISTIINPVILDYSSDKSDQWEICISDNYERNYLINRPKFIRVSYYNYDNDNISFVKCKTLNQYETRIFLHEIDHLNGIHFAGENIINSNVNKLNEEDKYKDEYKENETEKNFKKSSFKFIKQIKEIKFNDPYRDEFILKEINKGRI